MPWQQAKLDAMREKHGEHLEREFAFGQVGDHHTCILMFQYEAEHGQNQQIKDYAQQTIPTLEKHLRLAEDASAQWVSEARTAGARVPRNIEGTNGTNVGEPIRGKTNQGINR